MDTTQNVLVLIIPKSWCVTVLIKALDKLGHQGVNRNDHLIKQQYYWKGDKIAIDLVTDLNVSTSGNQHILTIIDHLTGWLEAYPIPNK